MSVYLVFTDGDHYDFAVTWLGAFTSREAAERAARHESLDPDRTWEGDLDEYRTQLSYYENRISYYRDRFVEDALDILDELIHEVKAGMRLEPNPYNDGRPCWAGKSLADKIVELRDAHNARDLRHGLLIEALAKTLDIYDDVHLHYMEKPDAPIKWRAWTGSPTFVRDDTCLWNFHNILKTCARRILRDELLCHKPKTPNPLDYRPDPVDGKLHRRTGCRYWVEEIEVDKETAR